MSCSLDAMVDVIAVLETIRERWHWAMLNWEYLTRLYRILAVQMCSWTGETQMLLEQSTPPSGGGRKLSPTKLRFGRSRGT